MTIGLMFSTLFTQQDQSNKKSPKKFSCSFFLKYDPPTFSVFLGSTRHGVYSGTVRKIEKVDFI